MAQIADRVYRNARIYSVALDGTEIHAEALAIRDGKFVYVGDAAGVEAWIGKHTEVIDCQGKSIIPGLGDAHMHLAHAGKKFGTCSLSSIVPDPKTDTPEGVIRQIQELISAYAEECIHAFTWKNAERMRLLDKIGSIEVGKRACLVVLDKDIFTIPDEEIHTIEPVCTFFDGQELHIPNPLKV
jgi:predicted amidohydrolase YtcJ